MEKKALVPGLNTLSWQWERELFIIFHPQFALLFVQRTNTALLCTTLSTAAHKQTIIVLIHFKKDALALDSLTAEYNTIFV